MATGQAYHAPHCHTGHPFEHLGIAGERPLHLDVAAANGGDVASGITHVGARFGDMDDVPMPCRSVVGSTSNSMPRTRMEYGGCSVTNRARLRERAAH